ncbi:class I histocompatibility antigen, F10 alpha chain-like [Hemicordylus capensis]|uniref:class I histocompatibility antigen, F10 alpha chain-like n=1 Tax=Hemicordylus capensis TaxID=884348 RepID=UPI00230480B9|nr:class I histocompatibility antigen, F10 alpha chain-like [Hemicordylus capensis]XP_053145476.1 class I histocompatibility antigen, F10 alpha chain-like [Hemicordylus capensis]
MGKTKRKATLTWEPWLARLKASVPRRSMPQEGRTGRHWSRKPSTGLLSPNRSGTTTPDLLSTPIKINPQRKDCSWCLSFFALTYSILFPPPHCKWTAMIQECRERPRHTPMALCWWLFLGAAVLPLGTCVATSPSHSLQYFYTAILERTLELSHFFIMEFMDDQLIAHYDRDTQQYLPRVLWVKEMEGNAHYWDLETQVSRNAEKDFRVNLVILQNRYNQSKGLHTLQWMYGCELSEEGHKRGSMQYGYDGRDFLSLDKETLTWTAADVRAQVTKRKLEAEPHYFQYLKKYLEEECIQRLQIYQDFRRADLQRQESPTGKVTRKPGYDALETLICRAHGFYPKEIDATWRKDGEILEHETLRGGVTPNSDGTYHTWLSIEIDPKDRKRYRCHVEHNGLPEPLVLAWEEPDSVSKGLIIGAILVIMFAVFFGVIYIRKRQITGYKATSSSSETTGSSSKSDTLYPHGA